MIIPLNFTDQLIKLIASKCHRHLRNEIYRQHIVFKNAEKQFTVWIFDTDLIEDESRVGRPVFEKLWVGRLAFGIADF